MKKILIIAAAVIVVALVLLIFVFKVFETPVDTGKDALNTDMNDPDAVVLTVEGMEVTWAEYSNWLIYGKALYENNYGEITDWTAPSVPDETQSIYEFVKNDTRYVLQLHKAIQLKAEELGIKLTDAEKQQIEDAVQQTKTQYGAEFDEFIKNSYGDETQYIYFLETSSLYAKCFDSLYGEKAEKFSDADMAEYTRDEEYLTAKHILFLTVDESGKEMSEEEKSQQKEKAENVLQQIEAYTGNDLEGYFTELMNQYSEDTGLAGFPDGYLFEEGDMVTEFYEGTIALKENEVSGIVQTDYGYHIIMRLPLNYDLAPVSQNSGVSLRYTVADNVFYTSLSDWSSTLDVKTSEFYDNFNAAKYFVG